MSELTPPEVVVTGRGTITSVAESPMELFAALVAGRSGIRDGLGACVDFDPEQWMTAKEARRMDRFSQLALAASLQAGREAGLLGEDDESTVALAVDPRRLGIVVGTGVGGLTTLQAECTAFLANGERAVSPNFVPMMMPNAAAGVVAIKLGAHGPGFSVSSACATGAHAIGEAVRLIQRGEADMVVAGGTEAALTSLCLAAFRRMGALSRTGISRPFDARRDGFVMGEGAAILVLERADHARARGAQSFGRIVGYGASNDAFHMTQPDENGRGAMEAMRAALGDAGAATGDVGYINCHGTGTPYNDRIETTAIHGIWNGSAPPVSSTKSALGHLLGAAGAVEALVSLEAVRQGVLPPTINYEEADPECDLDCIPRSARTASADLALSNSMGFGGQNACLAVTA
jgi:3-oxoacyl-[acyl-carrier-protein] synthase II